MLQKTPDSEITEATEITESYELLNPYGRADVVLICEHASNHIPDEFDRLGLDPSHLELHIAWDIGMAAITRTLSARLNAPALLARFSRLLIDPNREPDHKTLIPEISDGITIPGNQALTPAEREQRLNRFYRPFHERAERLVRHRKGAGHVPLVCGMHSFTPVMNGVRRPWHAGMLWNRDPRLARELIHRLQHKHGLMVGDNKPYSGQDLFHTMNRHGADHGFPQVTIEIRQDEILDESGQRRWSEILYQELAELQQQPDLKKIQHY
ncbi:N-formylglutamate amidohydrolase [Luteithermobacter gelatinilyticus]|uniref:N-formylglutamate amidohydrolase n=1 Tax=Luteithermobacter gelatinilyticus TaxID=2582913 RepID=UPI001106574F|nr:N-formylglutamate amidohydrolase [Luteithermobacter gelatinilyticus]